MCLLSISTPFVSDKGTWGHSKLLRNGKHICWESKNLARRCILSLLSPSPNHISHALFVLSVFTTYHFSHRSPPFVINHDQNHIYSKSSSYSCLFEETIYGLNVHSSISFYSRSVSYIAFNLFLNKLNIIHSMPSFFIFFFKSLYFFSIFSIAYSQSLYPGTVFLSPAYLLFLKILNGSGFLCDTTSDLFIFFGFSL